MRLFDLHCDTLTVCCREGASLCLNDKEVDLRRGRRYRPWCQVFAVFIPDTLRGAAAFRYAKRVLAYAREQEKRYPQQLTLATDGEALKKAARRDNCVGILAIEGAAALNGRVEHIARFAALGVRVMTLTWNGENELGYGCLSKDGKGLTPFGRRAVCEMHRRGIVPDVSHLNEAGFWDVATLGDAPFIASHSLSRAVHEHPRNLSDAQFKEIRRRGGLVGLNFDSDQLGEPHFEAIYRHAEHYLSLDGERTVALGGDLDGTVLPEEWRGLEMYEPLWEYLARKGLSEAVLERLFFRNSFDFFANTLQSAENEVK